MATYRYTAIDNENGKKVKGVIESPSEQHVKDMLRSQNLTPLSIQLELKNKSAKKKNLFKFNNKLRVSELSLLTRQMATLLMSGMPIDEVLYSIAQQSKKNKIKSVVLGVRAKVMEGYSLAVAMELYPHVFSQLYCTTVSSGEQSGRLDIVLSHLAEYLDRRNRMRQKIMQALIYPALMIVVSFSVVTFLMLYVVPKIIEVFQNTGQALPFVTILLLDLSAFIHKYGIVVLVMLVLLIWLAKKFFAIPKNKQRLDRFIQRIPLIGKLIILINASRFGRTLSILLTASVPILDAMRQSAQLVSLLPMRAAIIAASDKVKEGSSLAMTIEKTGYFSVIFVHLIASGEASGSLEKMLNKAVESQDDDVALILDSTLTLFEPIMILIMGGVVLFIVLAVLLPIFNLNQMASLS